MDSLDLQRPKKAVDRLVNMEEREWAMLTPHLSYRQLKKGENWIAEGEKENS